MLISLVGFVLFGCAAAQHGLHGVCHGNPHFSEAQVIDQLSTLCDRNHDNSYSEVEMVVCFADIIHKPLPMPEATVLGMTYSTLISLASLSGFTIQRHEFTHEWHTRFHDSLAFAEATFDAFDANGNGVWSIQEIDSILNHIKANFDNGDGVLNPAEFEAFFTHMYTC